MLTGDVRFWIPATSAAGSTGRVHLLAVLIFVPLPEVLFVAAMYWISSGVWKTSIAGLAELANPDLWFLLRLKR
jgi:hypothetical protein